MQSVFAEAGPIAASSVYASTIRTVVKYIAIVAGIAIFLAVTIGIVLFYYQRETAYEEIMEEIRPAREYLATEVCANPIVRATLGEYNLCAAAARTAGQDPWVRASHIALVRMFGCSNGAWCNRLYDDVHGFMRLMLVLPCLTFLVAMWMYTSVRKSQHSYEGACISLPSYNHKDKIK
jgi:hypothetical protein